MDVGRAAAVISHTVAAALRHYFEKGELRAEALHTADFLQRICELQISARGTKAPITIDSLEAALQQLQEDFEWIKQWKFEERCGETDRESLPFQKGLLITISALRGLVTFLIKERGFAYVCTRRFTQDCLENLFSVIRRNRGGFNDHPEAQSAVQSLRLATCGQLLDSVSKGTNCENTPDVMLLQLGKQICLCVSF